MTWQRPRRNREDPLVQKIKIRIREAKPQANPETLEENVARGSFGERVSALLMQEHSPVRHVLGALSNCFIEHGGQQTLRDLYGLNEEELYQRIKEVL